MVTPRIQTHKLMGVILLIKNHPQNLLNQFEPRESDLKLRNILKKEKKKIHAHSNKIIETHRTIKINLDISAEVLCVIF